MSCLLCASVNQAEFPAEMNVHFPETRKSGEAECLALPENFGLSRLRLFGFCHPESGTVATKWD
jgi:hypothetical protein